MFFFFFFFGWWHSTIEHNVLSLLLNEEAFLFTLCVFTLYAFKLNHVVNITELLLFFFLIKANNNTLLII